MAEKIGFIIKDKTVAQNGVIELTIGLVSSDKTGTVEGVNKGCLGCNELPYILHSLSKSGYMSEEPLVHKPFGFPYTLDFEIYDNYPSLT